MNAPPRLYGSADYDEFGERDVTVPSLRAVQLVEASLCDDMPSYSPLRLGPTGRSVAQSYAVTLSKLSPDGSATGIFDDTPPEKFSAAEKRYQHAMNWLAFRDPNHRNQTRMGVYRDKQTKYTEAFEKTSAYNKAPNDANKDTTNTSVETSTYNNLVQAAYMDRVTMRKEGVEYYFSVVDNDSAMVRVEVSMIRSISLLFCDMKLTILECMCASLVADADGSSEYHKVKLQPESRAFLAKQKAAAGPQGETIESLTFGISRLEKINFLLTSTKNNTKLVSIAQETDTDSKAAVQKAVFDTGGEQLGQQINGNKEEIESLEARRQSLEKLRDADHPQKSASETV
ncbi:hypothetical protein BDM02DRAFT_3189419 [Thelephora ganbajun]|uniref:Uncharacterized protein n=1 Tax=Thelephora ganbajun TaxID=370292 RepID=A0ACB6Z8E0_THEGA|nr:hypothetical protein BDM02DRAFT_3189419 [Thelephora ganbajun]